jgi:hypothetical protein
MSELELDDLTYAQLVDEAHARIPTLSAQWTDHNPSDPGVVLIELFAWLVEMVLYRVNRVPDDNYRVFLSLLEGTAPQYDDPRSIEEAIRQTLLELRQPYRVVSQDDYENLLRHQLQPAAADELRLPGADRLPPQYAGWTSADVARVRCLPERNLENEPGGAAVSAPGHVSVILMLADATQSLAPDDLAFVKQGFLDRRRLIGTRVHVITPPRAATVKVTARLFLKADALYQPNQLNLNKKPVPQVAKEAIAAFVDPFTGGPDGQGWPFGRRLFVSDLITVLAGVDGVEAVDQVALGMNGAPPRSDIDALDVSEFELLTSTTSASDFTTLVREGIAWVAKAQS